MSPEDWLARYDEARRAQVNEMILAAINDSTTLNPPKPATQLVSQQLNANLDTLAPTLNHHRTQNDEVFSEIRDEISKIKDTQSQMLHNLSKINDSLSRMQTTTSQMNDTLSQMLSTTSKMCNDLPQIGTQYSEMHHIVVESVREIKQKLENVKLAPK